MCCYGRDNFGCWFLFIQTPNPKSQKTLIINPRLFHSLKNKPPNDEEDSEAKLKPSSSNQRPVTSTIRKMNIALFHATVSTFCLKVYLKKLKKSTTDDSGSKANISQHLFFYLCKVFVDVNSAHTSQFALFM
jgi:hypothetical protein